MSEKEEEVQPSCSSTFTGEEHLTESNVLLTTNQMQTLDDFYILNEIGEGSFSTVFLVSTKSKKMRCALKVCSKKTIQREKKVNQIFRERNNLKLLSTNENQRSFIVRLYATFHDEESLYFVLSYAPNRDIGEKMHKRVFEKDIAQFLVAEICLALDYIHSKGILHRDVKPENLLVKEDYHIMLSDFGSSIQMNEMNQVNTPNTVRKCSFVGSHLYVCPEVLNNETIDETCDYFSVGSILFEMLNGKAPFHDESEYLIFRRIVKNIYRFPDSFADSDARDMIRRLLHPKQSERLGAEATGGFQTIHDHPFFSTIDWDTLVEQISPLARYFKTPESNDDNANSLIKRW